MSDITTQRQAIQDVASVGYITGTLRDIAAVDLKKLREQYSKNNAFYEELRYLYQLVWRIAELHNKIPLIPDTAGTLYVAYTTNKHLYGSLNYDVMRAFTRATSAKDDCLIIGTTGKEVWRSAPKKRKSTTYLSFTDDAPSAEEVEKLLARVSQYAHVYVCYPGFVSVYRQEAAMLDITFRPDSVQSVRAEDLPDYFLEPDIEDMFAFFHTQVRYMLLQRLLLEAQLSRVAARLVRMDIADHNVDSLLHRERIKLSRAYNTFANARLLETVIGYTQWHRINQ